MSAVYGGIAQLAEHELCKLGVAGSTPVASTINNVLLERVPWKLKSAPPTRACSSVG